MGFLANLERRTSPENPSTSLDKPAAWLFDALGARSSHAREHGREAEGGVARDGAAREGRGGAVEVRAPYLLVGRVAPLEEP